MKTEPEKLLTPAYIPFRTFSRFINGLESSAIPTQIDKSIMPKMSGGDQSAMLVALRFLKLIDQDGAPSEELTKLIESNEESRGSVLKAILERAYPFLFKGSIDLKRATTRQVEEAFKAQGVSGSTVSKAMAFFLSAAKEGGIQVSQYVKTPPIVRSTVRRVPPSQGGTPANDEEDQGMEDLPGGVHRLRLPLPGKSDVLLVVPRGFTKEDWDFIHPVMETYLSRIFKEGVP